MEHALVTHRLKRTANIAQPRSLRSLGSKKLHFFLPVSLIVSIEEHMKRNCLNCHFLCKEHQPENGRVFKFSLSEEERKKLSADPVGFDRGWHSLSCYMGVWDEGVTPVSSEEDAVLFSQDRGYDCFFFPYRKSMLFPAAVEMQKREEANRQLKRSHRFTVVGLWIAGIGLFLNVLVTIYKK